MTSNSRSIKVLSQSGYRYRETPAIILKGQWLNDWGFEIGDYVCVSCENGRLIITPDTEKAELIQAEKAFMDREMKALQKKFDAEKEKLRVQYVAEREAAYGRG